MIIDELNSTEQEALGNFFMLIGQTLCTSGSEYFKRDWKRKGFNDNGYSNNGSGNNSQEETINMLNKTRNIINKEIDKLQN